MAYRDSPPTERANRRFIQNAMRKPMLEAELEWDLARRWRDKNDEDALHQLTASYMRLVISMAGRYRNYGLPMGDLIQEGNIGLMQAAARFDPERQFRFSTYASWWIRSSIQDFILRNWSIVRTGSTASQKSLFFNLRRLRRLIQDDTSLGLTPEGVTLISSELGVSEADVISMDGRLSGGDSSLNAKVGEQTDEASEWQDLLPCDRPLPEDIAMTHVDDDVRKEWIRTAVDNLTEREQFIITRRRLSEDGVTLQSLADQLGISKERVRQVEHQALQKIKQALIDEVGDPYESGLISA